MLRKSFLQITLAGALGAVALLASDFWKSKESSQWTNEEVVKLLTDSPWAKQITVTSGQQGGGQRRGGGMGRRGGGMGGGYPGGGGGYPGGGGGDSSGYSKQEIILRWESAAPVQEALKRQHAHSEDDAKPAADTQKYYVVSMLGFQAPSRRNEYDTSDSDGSAKSDKQSADDLRNRYLDTAQLIPKSKIAISAEDVQFEGRNGSTAIRFLFPKTFPLSKDDKEIDFHFQYRGVKFEHKFKLGDMVYQGQVAL